MALSEHNARPPLCFAPLITVYFAPPPAPLRFAPLAESVGSATDSDTADTLRFFFKLADPMPLRFT